MTTYRLVDHGYPFKKIMCGKAWVGRVIRKADGSGYFARIGKTIEVTCATEREAFEEAAARALGHPSAASLKARNSMVRADNRARRTAVRARVAPVAAAMERGDVRGMIDAMDVLFGFKK